MFLVKRFSDSEFQICCSDIEICKQLNVNGVVIGLLLSNGEIDIERTSQLAESAQPLQVTFHRAFDLCKEPIQALRQLMKIKGIQRVLTSGCKQTAWEGRENIKVSETSETGSRISYCLIG